ncbi:hypothetical protein [Roseomonas xinghualingensis]|uniref:hypothetical protein n=1 Tax=Roseomonas xinghualingensis TaxID=2986475 RepID=UPI0021F14DC7|nr:hypothetical protein [Roseomonas sp. SXEYE001]MCV4208035.1 hypothetical protein [Roseomonas sp. SXEYE001]
MRGAAFGACGLVLLAAPALAERVGVRVGDHPGHGRVVLDLAARDVPYRVEEVPGGVRVRLGPDLTVDLPSIRRLPRNVQGLSAEADGLRIAMRAGSRLRHYRLDKRLVLDVMDGGASAPRRGEARAAPGRRASQPPSQPRTMVAPEVAAPAGVAAPTAPVAVVALPPPEASMAPGRPPIQAQAMVEAAAPKSATPQAGLALRVVAVGEGRALALPLTAETGLAILRRGELLLVVLDRAHALDATPLRSDAVFGGMRVETLPEATILSLPIAGPSALHARREGDRWLLEAQASARRERSILAEAEEGLLVLRVASPGRPVPVVDPETGLPLLVGTVREPGQAMAAPRSLPQVDLLATQLGVAALARADSAALRRAGDRFLLSGVAAVSAMPDMADTAEMTRLMEFPALELAAGLERLKAQQGGIAATPPLARLPLRRAAAEGLLALGLAQEAQAMIRLSFQEDPRASSDPRSLLVHAAAALLAGRPAEAQGLSSASLPASDEVMLWRAALAASAGEAAPGFAATLPLLLSYPEPLQARLLPMAAKALMAQDDLPAARRLLREAGPRPDLAFARARLAEAEGRGEEALALYASVAEGRNRLARAQALRRSIELRLRAGALDPGGAATALEAVLFAWRGDGEEFAARLRIAELRLEAGDGRAALELLREAGEVFPDRAAELRPAQEAALLKALTQQEPMAAAALSKVYAGLLPQDGRGAEALSLLAQRLEGMELPDRSAALIQQALALATPEQRPILAVRLASLRLAAGDAAAAQAALDAAPEKTVAHGLLMAQAKARLGRAEEAVALLRGLGVAGLPTLATLLAERQDWSGASDALAALAAAQPEDPGTPRELLRSAAFAALGGDAGRLAALRAAWLTRIGTGPEGEAFGLLTADPVRGLSDLPRLQRELNLFRGIPDRLEAFRTAAVSSR